MAGLLAGAMKPTDPLKPKKLYPDGTPNKDPNRPQPTQQLTADGNPIDFSDTQSTPTSGFDPVGYDPERRTVGEEQTVAGQMKKVLDENSPFIQQQEAVGLQGANAKGLLNSTMGIEAGRSAAIRAALQIAPQDAATFGSAAAENMAAGNTARQFNAGSSNQFGLAKLSGAQQLEQIGATGEQSRLTQAQGATLQERLAKVDADLKAGLIDKQTAADLKKQENEGNIQTGLQKLRGEQAQKLADTEAQYKLLMQSSASAAQTFAAAQKAIADIMNDPETSAEQKQAAVNMQTTMLNSSLKIAGITANVDYGPTLDFTGLVPPAGSQNSTQTIADLQKQISDLTESMRIRGYGNQPPPSSDSI